MILNDGGGSAPKKPSVPSYSRGAIVRRLNGNGNKRVRNKGINRGGPSVEVRAQRAKQSFETTAKKNAVSKNYAQKNPLSFLTR